MKALLFDFDGVLVDSEYAGNAHLSRYFTSIGHPLSPEESMARFMGLAGADFIAKVEAWLGRAMPEDFADARKAEDERAMAEGLAAVAGAAAFVRALPAGLPRAITSSSSTRWIRRHLDHIGLEGAFGDHIYSGREHVAKGKPDPALYLYAAGQLGVRIEECVIIEDSPVGATGALASGARVIGLTAGSHCAPDHATRLRVLGVREIAASFDEVTALLF